MEVQDITIFTNLIEILDTNMENKRITEIFKNICDELGEGSFQYYSTVVKTHYLQITGIKIPTVFLIHSDEIGFKASEVPMYVIKTNPGGGLPTEELVTISYKNIEDYVYRYLASL